MSAMDEDDEVVQEIPVFLSQDLVNNLYLLQYPLRPADRPYDKDLGSLDNVRVKPKQKLVELEYSLDVTTTNYDEDRDPPIRKFKLSSTVIPPKTNYAVGVMRDGQLHLSPLHAVCRMRPDFSYIDKEEAELKAETEMVDEEEDDRKDESKQVTMKFKKKESDKAAAYKKNSHAHLKQLQEAEPWMEMRFFGKDDPESTNQFEKLICQSAAPLTFGVAPRDYLSYINPSVEAMEHNSTILAQGGSAWQQELRITAPRLPVAEQVVTLLNSARVITLGQAVQLTEAKNSQEVQSVLAALERMAWLVQGCWVIKSPSITANTPNPRLSQSRDYLLTQFAKHRTILRSNCAMVMRLPLEDMEGLLSEMAVPVRLGEEDQQQKGWEFKLPTDHTFIRAFPQLVREHERKLNDLESRMRYVLEQSYSTDEVQILSSFPSASSSSAPSSALSASSSLSASSMIKLEGKTKPNLDVVEGTTEALVSYLSMMFNRYGVLHRRYLKDKFQAKQHELPVGDDVNMLALVREEQYEQTLSSLTMAINDDLLVRKSLNNPEVDKYRTVLAALFSINPRVKHADVMTKCREMLGEEMSEGLYRKLLSEFAVTDKSFRVLKSGVYDD